jgi:hypothetical protein
MTYFQLSGKVGTLFLKHGVTVTVHSGFKTAAWGPFRCQRKVLCSVLVTYTHLICKRKHCSNFAENIMRHLVKCSHPGICTPMV